VVRGLPAPSRGDTKKPGGEWRALPTCRGGDRSLTWLDGPETAKVARLENTT